MISIYTCFFNFLTNGTIITFHKVIYCFNSLYARFKQIKIGVVIIYLQANVVYNSRKVHNFFIKNYRNYRYIVIKLSKINNNMMKSFQWFAINSLKNEHDIIHSCTTTRISKLHFIANELIRMRLKNFISGV